MAKILDRLPIETCDDIAFVGSERIDIKANEIMVWVSLSEHRVSIWNVNTPRFPAILDTAHTHYFSIQRQHLSRWTGLQPELLRSLGHIRQAGRQVPLFAAKLWLHCNVRSGRAVHPGRAPQLLELSRGIGVYPDEAGFPRLPLLGMRAVLENRLHIAIDGQRQRVTLRTPDWRTELYSWLGT